MLWFEVVSISKEKNLYFLPKNQTMYGAWYLQMFQEKFPWKMVMYGTSTFANGFFAIAFKVKHSSSIDTYQVFLIFH